MLKRTTLFLLMTFSFSSFAQPGNLQTSCEDDFKKFCSSEDLDFKSKLKCLMSHQKELSLSCKQEIQRNKELTIQTKPPQGLLFSGAGGMAGRMSFIPILRYQGEISGAKRKSKLQEKGEIGISRHIIEGSAPLGKYFGGGLSASFRYGRTNFSDPVALNNGFAVDDELHQFQMGFNYGQKLSEGRGWGVNTSLGYKGDRIGGSDANMSVMTNYSYPSESGKGRWQYFLMFSNNGPLGNNIPIPGVMYFYKTKNTNLLVGLPIVSFQYTPTDSLWSFSLSSFGPFYKGEIFYGTVDSYQLFIYSQWNQDNYFLSNRLEEEDRLNIYEKVSGIGARTSLMKGTMGLELRLGYSSDRKLYSGDGIFNNDSGSVDLKDTTYLRFLLSKVF